MARSLAKTLRRARKRLRHALRPVRHALVYALTLLVWAGMNILPVRWAVGLGGALGALAFELVPSERRKTLESLRLAWGDKMDEAERRRLGRQVFCNAGRSLAEGALLLGPRRGNILDRVRVEGIDHLARPGREGRGAIGLTAHYGNWELLLPMVRPALDCELGAVARELSNPFMDRLVNKLRRSSGVRVFARGRTGRDYVRFLRRGNTLGMLGDIDTRKGDGVFVEFFGRPAWTQRGIAQLARLGRAAVVPAFIERDTDDPTRHVVRIEPELPQPQTDDEEQWVRQMTQAFTDAIERAVRRRPDQWMWMHRRWRHQPGDERLKRWTDHTDAASNQGGGG